jgi:hypothetical protein
VRDLFTFCWHFFFIFSILSLPLSQKKLLLFCGYRLQENGFWRDQNALTVTVSLSFLGITTSSGITLQAVQRLPTLQQVGSPGVGQPVTAIQTVASTGLVQTAAAVSGVGQPAAAAAGAAVQTAGVLQSVGGGAAPSPLKANVVVGIQPLGQNTVSYKVRPCHFSKLNAVLSVYVKEAVLPNLDGLYLLMISLELIRHNLGDAPIVFKTNSCPLVLCSLVVLLKGWLSVCELGDCHWLLAILWQSC